MAERERKSTALAFLIRIYPLCRIERATGEKGTKSLFHCSVCVLCSCFARIKWHTLCFKVSIFVTFLSLFRQFWSWFFRSFYLHQTHCSPLSVLLNWMNCRFVKYCCCHFALSLTLAHTQSWNTFQPNSTQSNPMEKSHCFLAQRRDCEKNRGKERK